MDYKQPITRLHLGHRWIYLALVFLVMLAVFRWQMGSAGPLTELPPQPQVISEPLRPLDIIQAVNEVRLTAGLLPLKTESLLFKSALAKANDMCDRGYFSHDSPTGINPWYWLQQSQFEFATAGENLARNVTDLDELVLGWNDSPTHQENMLNQEFTQTGVAIRTCTMEDQETMVVVQHFASQTPTD